MLLPEQEDSVCQHQHPACMHGRQRPIGQIDQCLLDGSNPQTLADDMFVLAHLSEEYVSARLTCTSTRHSERCSERRSGQRSSERRTGQRDSHIKRASFKRVPRMGDLRTDRTTGHTTTRISEYVNMPDHQVDGAPEVTLVAGIASMLNLRKMVKQQKSEGYTSVMDTEYINPRPKVQANPVHPQPSGSSSRFGSAYSATEPVRNSTRTSDDFLTNAFQEPGAIPSAADVLIPIPAEKPPAKRRPFVAKKLAAMNITAS
jgi:hypothetical protein